MEAGVGPWCEEKRDGFRGLGEGFGFWVVARAAWDGVEISYVYRDVNDLT